jgi:hypothetical protein
MLSECDVHGAACGHVVSPGPCREQQVSDRGVMTCAYDRRMAAEMVTGPASCSPSIEKEYGPSARFRDTVAMRENDDATGHGHANAIVAYHSAEQGR